MSMILCTVENQFQSKHPHQCPHDSNDKDPGLPEEIEHLCLYVCIFI